MELLILLVVGWVGWKAVKALRPTLKAANYFIACQVALMKWSDADLSTAKTFVSDHHPFFARSYEHGSSPEQAVFACCQFLLERDMTDSTAGKHRATATAFGHGVIRLMPDSPVAQSFKRLLPPYAT